jgi:hypothetical protein
VGSNLIELTPELFDQDLRIDRILTIFFAATSFKISISRSRSAVLLGHLGHRRFVRLAQDLYHPLFWKSVLLHGFSVALGAILLSFSWSGKHPARSSDDAIFAMMKRGFNACESAKPRVVVTMELRLTRFVSWG